MSYAYPAALSFDGYVQKMAYAGVGMRASTFVFSTATLTIQKQLLSYLTGKALFRLMQAKLKMLPMLMDLMRFSCQQQADSNTPVW